MCYTGICPYENVLGEPIGKCPKPCWWNVFEKEEEEREEQEEKRREEMRMQELEDLEEEFFEDEKKGE